MEKIEKILEFNLIKATVGKLTFSRSSQNEVDKLNLNSNFDEVTYHLNLTDEMLSLILRQGSLPFVSDYDIFSVLSKLKIASTLLLDDFHGLMRFLKLETNLLSFTSKTSSLLHLHERFKSIQAHQKVKEAIDLVMDIDLNIFDDASPELKSIRKNLKTKTQTLQKNLGGLLTKYQTYLNESLIVKRNDRYCIPVKDTYKHKIKGVIHDVSASKQTIYIEPDEIRQITQDLEYLTKLESTEIEKILRVLSGFIAPHYETLYHNLQLFIELDMIHAKAKYAKEIDGIKPILNQVGNVKLFQARHPLIDQKVVVPINVEMTQEKPTLLITGPNTGGKTVALKTVGLLTLMMQTGFLIPASDQSEMAVFDAVYADIGDEQSIAQSLSTFSSHLTNIKKMIDELKPRTLILLDELGSGTDPLEGVVLAISIMDYLRSFQDIRLMVTTHYSELKLYAFEQADILNASVAFDHVTLKPLYKLSLGIAGSSHALEIAEKLGLKRTIIDQAKTLLNNRQSDLSKSIEKLTQEQAAVETLKHTVEDKEKELMTLIQTYEAKMISFEQEKGFLIEKIKTEELKKYEQLKRETLQLIDELTKKAVLTKPESAKLKGSLNKNQKVDVADEQSNKFLIGDLVYIKPYHQEGEIIDQKKNDYVVSFGPFTMSFKGKELLKIESKKSKNKQATHASKVTVTAQIKTAVHELDLRGVRYQDVKDLMDQAIDQALLAHVSSIRIIHGYGTGVVRKAVYEYIKQSSYIKSHRYGGEGEGFMGVTIISL